MKRFLTVAILSITVVAHAETVTDFGADNSACFKSAFDVKQEVVNNNHRTLYEVNNLPTKALYAIGDKIVYIQCWGSYSGINKITVYSKDEWEAKNRLDAERAKIASKREQEARSERLSKIGL